MGNHDQSFDEWNEQKKFLDKSERGIYFKQGDIWWISVGLNVGSESFGKGPGFRRPVLVIRKLSSKLFIGIPLSTKLKEGSWFRSINFHGKNQTALIYQIRAFDAKRLQRKLTELDENDFNNVKQSIKKLILS